MCCLTKPFTFKKAGSNFHFSWISLIGSEALCISSISKDPMVHALFLPLSFNGKNEKMWNRHVFQFLCLGLGPELSILVKNRVIGPKLEPCALK